MVAQMRLPARVDLHFYIHQLFGSVPDLSHLGSGRARAGCHVPAQLRNGKISFFDRDVHLLGFFPKRLICQHESHVKKGKGAVEMIRQRLVGISLPHTVRIKAQRYADDPFPRAVAIAFVRHNRNCFWLKAGDGLFFQQFFRHGIDRHQHEIGLEGAPPYLFAGCCRTWQCCHRFRLPFYDRLTVPDDLGFLRRQLVSASNAPARAPHNPQSAQRHTFIGQMRSGMTGSARSPSSDFSP
ncbi:MAG: hypothetical protein J6H20_07605 [Pyramidobacter sp.]|nr:hypothetical protein [Pyramidobacter sp.]